jgi:hypothetical protein
MPLLELVAVVVGTAMMAEITGQTDMVALVALPVSLVAPLPTAAAPPIPSSVTADHNPLLALVEVGRTKMVVLGLLVVLGVLVPVVTVVTNQVAQMRTAAAVVLVAGATTVVVVVAVGMGVTTIRTVEMEVAVVVVAVPSKAT